MQQVGRAVDLDDADHTACRRLEALEKAQCGDLDAQLFSGLENCRTVGDLDLAIVYG